MKDVMKKIKKYVDDEERTMCIRAEFYEKVNEYSLCYNDCIFFKPDEPDKNCELNRAVNSTNKQFGIVTPVFACEKYFPKGLKYE